MLKWFEPAAADDVVNGGYITNPGAIEGASDWTRSEQTLFLLGGRVGSSPGQKLQWQATRANPCNVASEDSLSFFLKKKNTPSEITDSDGTDSPNDPHHLINIVQSRAAW
jgi:hypothetical protein